MNCLSVFQHTHMLYMCKLKFWNPRYKKKKKKYKPTYQNHNNFFQTKNKYINKKYKIHKQTHKINDNFPDKSK